MSRRLGCSGLVGSLVLLCVDSAPAQIAPPTVTSAAVTPAAVTPAAVTPAAVTPAAVTPAATPAAGAPSPAAPTKDVGASTDQTSTDGSSPPYVSPPFTQSTHVPAGSAIPRFVKLLPSRYNRDEISVAVDQELRLAVVVEHPEGRPLQMQALGLPQRAHFDPLLRSVTWRPTEAEIGSYQVRFLASDGVHEASRTLLVSVTENRPPNVGSLWFEIPAGHPATWFIEASDPEGEPMHFSAEGLPPGAYLNEHTGHLTFLPKPSQVGEYPIVIHVSDGQKVSTQRGTIAVRPPQRTPSDQDDWTSFLLPGVGYSIYSPRDHADTVFHGLNLELVVAAWISRNDNRGPSHGRVYINTELLNATGLNIPLMFGYSAGLSLSFERNPQRNWLIPHYGFEVGGIVHQRTGAFFQATPYAGLHLFSSPNVFLGARLGYRLVPSRVDELAGLHVGIITDISIW